MNKKFKSGIFENGIPFIEYGNLDKKIVYFQGSGGLLWKLQDKPKFFMNLFKAHTPKDYGFVVLGYDHNMPSTHTPMDIADNFASIIKKNYGKSYITGLSYGGTVATPFASTYPELTEKLVMQLSAIKVSEKSKVFVEDLLKTAREGDYKEVMKVFISLYESPVKRFFFKLLLWRTGLLKEHSLNPIIYGYRNAVSFEGKGIELASKIKVPTLVIGAKRDIFFSGDAFEFTHKTIPNSRLTMLDASHGAAKEKSKEIAEILREFLDD